MASPAFPYELVAAARSARARCAETTEASRLAAEEARKASSLAFDLGRQADAALQSYADAMLAERERNA